MKTLGFLLAVVFIALSAHAQTRIFAFTDSGLASALPASCSAPSFYKATDTQVLYACSAGDGLLGSYVPVNALPSFTVAFLPSAPTYINQIVIASDSLTAGSCTSGGGSNRTLCFSTGLAWVPVGGAGGGSVGPGTTGFFSCFASSTTIGNCHMDDGVTTASTIHSSENVETTGTLTTGVGGSTAGLDGLGGNTSNPSLPSNAAGWLGPASASFTSYFGQFPSSAPSAHSVIIWPAPTANVAAFSFKVIPDCQDSGGNHLNYTQSTDAFSCGTSSSGGGFDPLDRTTIEFRDEFVGTGIAGGGVTTGDVTWGVGSLGGGTATTAIPSNTFPHWGVLRIAAAAADTTTAHGMSLFLGNASNTVALIDGLGSRVFDSYFIVRPTNTTNGQYLIGFDGQDNSLNNGCYIKFDTTNSDTNWVARCQTGGAPTDVPLASTAPSTTNWTTMHIWASIAGTINFAACNGDGCSLPTSGTSGTTAGFACFNSGGTGGCTTSSHTGVTNLDIVLFAINANTTHAALDIDFVSMKLTSTGR